MCFERCSPIQQLQGCHFNAFDYKSLGLPLVYMKGHSCLYWLCVCLPPKVLDLEQQLVDCEDALDHYQNIVSLCKRLLQHKANFSLARVVVHSRLWQLFRNLCGYCHGLYHAQLLLDSLYSLLWNSNGIYWCHHPLFYVHPTGLRNYVLRVELEWEQHKWEQHKWEH